MDPDRFTWSDPPYEYESVKRPIDILSGSQDLRKQLDADVPAAEIARGWAPALEAFLPIRSKFLLY